MIFIEAADLKTELADGLEISLLDVREQGQYGEGHPFHAVPLAYSRLELEIGRLVPNPAVRVVLFAQTDSLSICAAARLAALGYRNVRILRNGAAGWRAAGYTLFKGVHVPSKTLGELVELTSHTPTMTPGQLNDMRGQGRKVVVLDGRPREEYTKMTIPGAVCCPNAELALRLHRLAPDPATTVVVNCAGRTRSIIGAQSLINVGVPHAVYALENGTQGWFLGDHALEHGSQRFYPDDVGADDPALAVRRQKAAALAQSCQVATATAAQLARWSSDPSRTTYLFDVRTAEEFKAGSVPGAIHAAGGQLIQGTDLYMGVRHARVVLHDTDGIRAPVTGSWLSQMGYEVYVLDPDEAGAVSFPVMDCFSAELLAEIPPLLLKKRMDEGEVQLIDLRPSLAYRQSHVVGAAWSTRSRIVLDAKAGTEVVLIAADARMAALAASELPGPQREKARFLADDNKAWLAAGLVLEATPALPADEDCIDFLFFVHDRHDGNKQAARDYLAWETHLVSQLDAQEKKSYRLRSQAVA